MIVGLALAAPASASAGCFLGIGDCGNNGNGPPGGNVGDVTQGQLQDQFQSQAQDQGQFQEQSGFNAQGQVGINKAVGSGNETSVEVEGDTTVFEAQKRNPVSSAAPVFATACSRGVSGQFVGVGGAIAANNEICDLATAAELAERTGNMELRDKLVARAGDLALARANRLRVWFQWVPFVGQLY